MEGGIIESQREVSGSDAVFPFVCGAAHQLGHCANTVSLLLRIAVS